jgi:four helix bundle protein
MGIEGFQGLKVWQKSKVVAVLIYRLTDSEKFRRDFVFKNQFRRAAVSISSNIAEGDELGSDRQAVRFFKIAKGSAAELLSQAIIAKEIGYIKSEDLQELNSRCTEILKMRSKLISVRSGNNSFLMPNA